MKIKCDFHVHTALSPCAMEEMTPNNIVNMSLLNELDVIAITDHNTCENTRSVMEVASETDLIVIPGIEVETSEEIHMVCLFETLIQALQVQEEVYKYLPPKRNNSKIFGEQLLLDVEDEVIGRNDKLLSFATAISIDDLVSLVNLVGGVCVPAHIDRPSYSVLSNLGMLPEHLSFPVLELSRFTPIAEFTERYPNHLLIQSSDAHELAFIGECECSIDVEERSIAGVLASLRKGRY